jgi:hypothetical protein
MRTQFNIVFTIALLGILATWAFYGYVAVTAVKTTSEYCKDKSLPNCLGSAVKEFENGMKQ